MELTLTDKFLVLIIVNSVFLDVSYASATADKTIFGITLDQPLNLPDCPKSSNGHYSLILTKRTGLCALKDQPTKEAWGTSSVKVYFPNNEAPDFVRMGSFSVGIIDDKIAIITIPTNGISTQDKVLHVLKNKYGPPTKFSKIAVQNAFGIKFVKYIAQWKPEGMSIEYDSAQGDKTWGNISVSTPVYDATYNNWKQNRNEKQIKF